jgi:hypothetical protein
MAGDEPNDEPARADFDVLAVNDERRGVLEARRALNDTHAKCGEALLGIVWRDCRMTCLFR